LAVTDADPVAADFAVCHRKVCPDPMNILGRDP
jgi:hypothetical protein